MSDLIERQAAIAAADRADYTGFAVEDVKTVTDEVIKELKQLPSVHPARCEDCENFSKTRLLIPQPERKTGEWLHELLQDAIDAGIITEVQAVRIMERVNK